MQYAVDNDTMQFVFVSKIKSTGIRAYGIETDKQVAIHRIRFAGIEGDDVGVVVMIEKFLIGFQDIFVITEKIGDIGCILRLSTYRRSVF